MFVKKSQLNFSKAMYKILKTRYNAYSKTENDVFSEQRFCDANISKRLMRQGFWAAAFHPEAIAKATDALR